MKQMRKPKHTTFLECSLMSRVFYHCVIHGLGFLVCFMIQIRRRDIDKDRQAGAI